jgi:hypothetical protein
LAFIPVKLLLLPSSWTRTGELRRHCIGGSVMTLRRRAILDRKDRSKTAKSSEDIVVDVSF